MTVFFKSDATDTVFNAFDAEMKKMSEEGR